MQYFTHTLLIITVLIFVSCVNSETGGQSIPPPTQEKTKTSNLVEQTPQPTKDTLVAKPVKLKPSVTPSPAKPPKQIAKTKQVPKTPPPPKKVNPPAQPSSKVVSTPPPVAKPTSPPPPIKRAGVLRFENKMLNYGYIEQGKVIDHVFKYTNVSNVPVNILNAEASCGCTRPTYSFMQIEPGATGEIGVRFDSNGKLGKMESSVTVLTDANPAKHHLYLMGTITDPPKKEKKEVEKKDDEEKGNEKEDSQEKDVKEIEEKEPTEEETQKKPFKGRKLPKGTLPGSNKEEEGKG